MGHSAGPYRAVVDDDRDPLRQGRLKVVVHAVGEGPVWASACLPPMPVGMLAMPGVGSTVWVQFEGGDLNYPVWTGITWDTAMLADQAITSATSVTVRAPMVTVVAGSTDVTGVLKCQTLIADTVIASSYTPGAGNVW